MALTLALVALAGLGAALATTASAVQITEYALPAGARPFDITTGPDGNMWFTDKGTNTIDKITTSGQVSEYGLGITPNAGLNDIAAGPDGNMWFTERDGHKIGRITTAGAVTEFSNGLTGPPDVYGITGGPAGQVWFTETFNSRVGAINPGSGAVKEFGVPTGTYTDIVQGPDGNLWFASPDKATISRMTPTGAVTAFGPLSASDCATGAASPCPYPDSLAVGPDGNLWFNEVRGNAIGRITAAGGISEFTDGLTHGAGVSHLTSGPEGNLWFTEASANQVGRITPAGTITEFHNGLSPSALPIGIALGPDQNLWVAEYNAGKIARVIPDVPPIVVTSTAAAIGAKSAFVTGTVRARGAASHYVFEYGPTAAYGRITASGDSGSGDSPALFGMQLAGLKPNHEYHYRIVASNASGVTYGSDASFRTLPLKHHRGKRAKLTVKPFQTYLAAVEHGRGHLMVSKIILIDLRRGEHVSFHCRHCGGKPEHGRKRAKKARLVFRGLKLVVGPHSSLSIAVAAKNKSKRVKTYGILVHRGETKLKSQHCFLPGKHKAVSCSTGHRGKHGKHHGKKKA